MKRKQWKWSLMVLLIHGAVAVGPAFTDDLCNFVAPVVPVSQMNRTYSGSSVYIGMFKPQPDGRWNGNLKKYAIDPDSGNIIGVDPITGEILDGARSVWSEVNDGKDVLSGGAGPKLYTQRHSRKIYTNRVSLVPLTAKRNGFRATNASLTAKKLETTMDYKDSLIADIIGVGRTFDEGEIPWIMGDILHSAPAVARLGHKTCIFVGANDGMLHCFWDKGDDVSELWAFIPDDLLPKLKRLTDIINTHDYFVDGTPTVFSSGKDKILFFGERRGGYYYHALKVTDPEAPAHLYKIGPNRLSRAGEEIEQLGQSWGNPLIGSIKTRKAKSEKVIILPGGYDTNQDKATPDLHDHKGRAVFAVKASNGNLSEFHYCHDSAFNRDMTHSIVDVTGADTNEDGAIDRVYAGDMNGQIFAFEDHGADGTWNKRLLFKASSDGKQRKIFGAPDMVTITSPVGVSGTMSVGEMIFFGTGDMAHPRDTGVVNRIYAVKNYWDEDSREMTVDTVIDGEYAFCDATKDFIHMGTEDEKEDFGRCLTQDQNRGWFFDLEGKGEQIVGSPVVYNGAVYFTTYTPADENAKIKDDDGTLRDAAATGGAGRLYAVDARTAAAVLNLRKPLEQDNNHNEVGDEGNLGKGDRSGIISDSMPSAAMVAIFKNGAQILVGAKGKLFKQDTALRPDLHMHYWRDMNNGK